jgi:sn-glycerol 3-phosphate transport system ATP-binding protein
VFLFDEPLSNLDAKLRVQMRAEIARLHLRLKTTIIYVTHDQVEAMTLGDRIVLMDRGVIQQVDTPMKIYQRPANQFVASFIGSPAMNFVPGQIENGAFRYAGAATNGDAAPTNEVQIDGAPNGPATLGVRPEDLLVDSEPPGSSRRFATVTLDVVEHMGHETIAHFALAGADHVARLPATTRVQPGDRLPLSIRSGRVPPLSPPPRRPPHELITINELTRIYLRTRRHAVLGQRRCLHQWFRVPPPSRDNAQYRRQEARHDLSA